MARRQRSQLDAPAEEERVGADQERLGSAADQNCESGLDRAVVARFDHADLDPQSRGRGRHVFRHRHGWRISGVDQQSDPLSGGDKLVQQSQLLCR